MGDALAAEEPGEALPDAVPDAAVEDVPEVLLAAADAEAEGEGCRAGTDLKSRVAPHTTQTRSSVPLTPAAASSTVSQSAATWPRAGIISV